MDKKVKVKITYNTGFVLETYMSEFTFDYYTKNRQPMYNPECPTIDVNVEDKEFVSLYGAVKLERCD